LYQGTALAVPQKIKKTWALAPAAATLNWEKAQGLKTAIGTTKVVP
jgi:hypothetical protein